jgi:hypothetical protein
MRPVWAVALATAVALIGVATAQEAVPITDPVWVAEPARAQFRYPFSTSEYRTQVPLQCWVAGEALTECRAVELTPENFLGAAIEAASSARIAALDGDGAPTDGRAIAVTIRFPAMPIPIAVSPPPASITQRTIVNPVWLQEPTPTDFERFHPANALRGATIPLHCLVAVDGRLSCSITRREGEDTAFDQAALRVSMRYRMAAEDGEGLRTVGARISLAITFPDRPSP